MKRIVALFLCVSLTMLNYLNCLGAVNIQAEKSRLDVLWKKEDFDLSNMNKEWWYNLLSISSNVYQALINHVQWEKPDSSIAYKATMIDLLYDDSNPYEFSWELSNESYDVLGVSQDLYDLVSTAETMGTYKIGLGSGIGSIPDQIIFVSENLWNLSRMAIGTDIKFRGLSVLAQKGSSKIKKSAKTIVEQKNTLMNQGVGAALLTELFSEKTATHIAGCTLEEIFKIWSTAVNTTSYLLDKAAGTGKVTESVAQYQTYMYIQDDIEKCMNSLNPNQYESEELYLEDYKALSYLYIACSYKATMLLAESIGGLEKQAEQASAVYGNTLMDVMKVGQKTMNITNPSVVTVSEYCVPTNLSHGDYYVIYGLLSSTEQIRKVTVEFKGANGYLQCVEENINANQYDLHNMDSRLTINHLSPETYEYVVTVETVSGGRYEPIKETVSIEQEDGNMTIIGYRLPHPMSAGAIFNVVGTIQSPHTLREVRVEIWDMNGNYMTGGKAAGAFSGYNLKNLDRYVEFDRLGRGEYWYVITARNDVREEVLVKQKFIVK